ncbi:HAD family hydrolase [Rhizobium leguminosarum]|uniref:HAD family hydrolase n=1 Tax=Rhizobium leguminosarum TaxID=384 RepID=UPI001C94A7F3|nr:HAD family hydrolase [Rhizobium leguminosarum]MBY5645550.1 HAD family hydrolase [Rhizobium leguminosarum]
MVSQKRPENSAIKLASPRGSGPLVLIDADNTLWDTDGVFAEAQLRILAAVEKAMKLTASTDDRLAFVRGFDQDIAEQHHLGLRYPPRLLIDALAYGLRGVPLREAVRRAWNDAAYSGIERQIVSEIEHDFLEDISKQPKLLKGVMTGLRELASIGATMVVFTEGSRRRILRSVEYHQLIAFIDRVFEAPKTERMFARVKTLTKPEQSIYVIGDQLTRDIAPANRAGIPSIYIPGKFQPKWEIETKVQPTFRAQSFDAATAFLVSRENDALQDSSHDRL